LLLTANTGVADQQVEFEILATRPRSIEQFVGHVYLAVMTTGALSSRQSAHVGLAADVAVLWPDTASVLHPTVDRVRNDDHLIIAGTTRLESLPLAIFTLLTVSRCHFLAYRQHCCKQCIAKRKCKVSWWRNDYGDQAVVGSRSGRYQAT